MVTTASLSAADKSHYEDLPTGWVEVNLGDLFSIGSAKRIMKTDWTNEGIPFYRTREVVKLNEFGVVDNELYISDEYYQEIKDKYGVPLTNDIMLTAVGTIGIPYIVRENDIFYYKDASVLCLANIHNLNSRFFYYLLQSTDMRKQMFGESKGTTVDTITINKAEDFVLRLPPSDEQERIVEKIDIWIGVIRNIKESKDNLVSLINSMKSKILELAMQGKLVEQNPSDEPAADMLRRINPKAKIITDNPHCWNIPTSWVWCQLGDIFQHNTGKALNSSDNEGVEYDYITTSNVYWDRFELDSIKRMKFKDSELDKCSIRCGDLLVCEGGDIGRAAIWNYDVPMMIQNHLHRLRPMATEVSTELYCKVLKLYKDKNLIGGKGIGMLGFSSNALHKLVVPLMAYKEQIKIYSKIKELYNILDEIEASLQS